MSFKEFVRAHKTPQLNEKELLAIYTGLQDRQQDADTVIREVLQQKGSYPLTRVKYNGKTYDYTYGGTAQVEGSVNPGRYDEDVFRATCCLS